MSKEGQSIKAFIKEKKKVKRKMLAKQTHLYVAITMFSNVWLLFLSPFPIFWSFSLQFYIKK